MKELEERIAALCGEIIKDVEKNTKAAHARIRKATLNLEKVAREYRKASIAADKA